MNTQDHLRSLSLDVRPNGCEAAGDGDGADALPSKVPTRLLQGGNIQRRVLAAIVERSTAHEVSVAADYADEVIRPADHWRNAVSFWQCHANGGHLSQITALHEGVDELSRADHHRRQILGRHIRRLEDGADSIYQSIANIRSRGALRSGDHLVTQHNYCVGVCSSDVHT